MRPWFLSLALVALLAPPAAAADDYPSRPIRAIASQGPGGLSDVFMRALADELGPALGGTVIVENRTGAGGTIGARSCADAPPDGYTFCILPGEPIIFNPIIFPATGFDPKERLAPVTRVFYLTQVFAVTAALNVKSIDAVAALARAKPGTMSYMAPSLSKVAFMEAFNRKNRTDFVRVPFKGGGDAVNSMLTGTTPVAIFGLGNLINLIREGKILGLAVDGDQRSPLAPDIPTFRESGYTEHVMAAFFGIYAPAGTPKPMIDKLNQAIVKVASGPEFQKRHMIPRGLAPVLDSPEHFAKTLETDRAEGLQVVKDSGLHPEVK
jgi:tripartite-type tricarboxylate transporter receptor subunit TctC